MLDSDRMEPNDEFALESPGVAPVDPSWLSALLFETPEQIYQRVYRVLRPRSPVPPVQIRFEKFVNADSYIRLKDGTLSVRITDLLETAPSPVMEALAFILLGKLLRKKVPPSHAHRYRLYLNRRDIRQEAQKIRQERGRKLCSEPRGSVYDLDEIFDGLNLAHFHGLMAKPRLGWSLYASRTRLGHFDSSHQTIVISRIFDREEVDKRALEYVMFHEMLHLRFPVKHRGSRRCIHTPEFKQAEKQFPGFLEARKLLTTL